MRSVFTRRRAQVVIKPGQVTNQILLLYRQRAEPSIEVMVSKVFEDKSSSFCQSDASVLAEEINQHRHGVRMTSEDQLTPGCDAGDDQQQ